MTDPAEIRRVSTVRVSPSSQQVDAHWGAARSKKVKLLDSSDWTQLRDVANQLTPQQRLSWDAWRRSVRAVKSQNYATPQEFEAALDECARQLPVDPRLGHQVDSTAPEDDLLDDATSITASDAVYEIHDLAAVTIARKCGIVNPATLQERVSQALDVYASNGGPVNAPFISAAARLQDSPDKAIASDVLARYQKWLGATSELEALVQRTLRVIELIDDNDAIKNVIKELDVDITSLIKRIDDTNGH